MKPIQVAVIRAVAGGIALGAASFFGVWLVTDWQGAMTAFMIPFWGNIVTRGAAEGWWDTVKK